MRILIIRHAEPDYSIDGLTEKGKLEAELLSKRMVGEDIHAFYCSTLGRARLTIKPTLDATSKEAEYCEWLREFDYAGVKLPYPQSGEIAWDLLPQFVNTLPDVYSSDRWMECEHIRSSDIYKYYLEVNQEFDAVLEKHGYRRDGYNYRVEKANHDTIAFICHFGVSAVILSHILNCSPYSIWQNMCIAPTGVTTIYTEERNKGVASLRIASIGDVSHLYAGSEKPSFAARFCECFDDDTRH